MKMVCEKEVLVQGQSILKCLMGGCVYTASSRSKGTHLQKESLIPSSPASLVQR